MTTADQLAAELRLAGFFEHLGWTENGSPTTESSPIITLQIQSEQKTTTINDAKKEQGSTTTETLELNSAQAQKQGVQGNGFWKKLPQSSAELTEGNSVTAQPNEEENECQGPKQ